MNEIDTQINRTAQGYQSELEIETWYSSLSKEDRIHVLGRISYFCLQAHPTEEEIPVAVHNSGLKEAFTPCVIILKNDIKSALQKIIKLPESEHVKCLRLLLSLLRVADGRRRTTDCAGGCHHEWHNIQE